MPLISMFLQDPIQDPIIHLIVISLESVALHTNSSVFPCLSWPRHFMSTGQLFYWISLLFSHDSTEVMHFWQEYHRDDSMSSVRHMGFKILMCFMTRDFDLDHLVKVVSARFLSIRCFWKRVDRKYILWECTHT